MNQKSPIQTNNTTQFEKAKQIVFQILQYNLKKIGKEPYFDDDMKRLYRLLTLYFTRNPFFENEKLEAFVKETQQNFVQNYKLNKGLLLIGSTGRGKSYAMEQIFFQFVNRYVPDMKYARFNAYNIAAACENEGSKALVRLQQAFYLNYKPQHVYIDEIGAENTVVQHYGNKIEPIINILHSRHRHFVENRVITHASSNLTVHELGEKYDYRIKSRIMEMFNIIHISGKDLRLL